MWSLVTKKEKKNNEGSICERSRKQKRKGEGEDDISYDCAAFGGRSKGGGGEGEQYCLHIFMDQQPKTWLVLLSWKGCIASFAKPLFSPSNLTTPTLPIMYMIMFILAPRSET